MAHYYMCPGCKSVGKLHPIISCVRVWGVCCCAVLLKHGSDVNAVTRNGWTPLHSSSRYRHLEAARLLLGHGAEVGFETTGGETALHLVSGEGNLELGSLLHDCGTGMNGQSIYSRNPLYLALVYGHLGVAQSLLKHGADSTIQYVSSLYDMRGSHSGYWRSAQMSMRATIEAEHLFRWCWTALRRVGQRCRPKGTKLCSCCSIAQKARSSTPKL